MVIETGLDIASQSDMTAIRTVSFVSHLELNIESGKVLPGAITFGDVDNDGGNELIVGTTDGLLFVFRGSSRDPWCRITGLGEITSIAVGDIIGNGNNRVLVINTEGNSYLYDFTRCCESDPDVIQMTTPIADKDTSYRGRLEHLQLLQVNVKMIILGDVDKDGMNEVILCHTDRVVSACRWNKSTEAFDILQKWKLPNFVGAVTLHDHCDRGRQIIATQPGCSYALLHVSWTSVEKGEALPVKSDSDFSYNPMASLSRSHNPRAPCQIVGDICKGPEFKKGYFAICTLDGTIKLMEEDQVLWSFQVDHQLFAMNKLDVLADGKEEVVVCAWNGWTYIVDHDRNVVRYEFKENVQAFCAGQYAIEDKENFVSLVYADFRNKLYLYYNIQLQQMKNSNFLEEAEKNEQMRDLFAKLGAETKQQKASLIRYCMYGLHIEPEEAMSREKKELFRKSSTPYSD